MADIEKELLLENYKEALYENKEVLIDSLSDMILNAKFNAFNYINKIGTDSLKIFQSPSLDDKMILLNTIITSLYNISAYPQDKLDDIAINILKVYNKTNLSYVKDSDYTFYNILNKNEILLENENIRKIIEKLTFDDNIFELLNRLSKSNDNEKFIKQYNLTKIQIFTFASVFINIDRLLNDLIKYMIKNEE